MESPHVVRVAVDLLGGDAGAPEAVVEGVLLARAARPDVAPVLVGPPALAARLLAERGCAGTVATVAAAQAVDMSEDPARAVRARGDATIRVAARLVRDGAAEALVSAGPTGATVAAALFTFARLPGVTRPALAVVIPARHHPVVLLDAGADPEVSAPRLAQLAVAGSAYATVRLGLDAPRIGLLSVASEAGKGDAARRAASPLLAEEPVRFVGNVEGHDVPLGGPADVVVTDGFTGNVLLKGLEGAVALVGGDLDVDALGGAVLLGVDAVAVVTHGAATARAIAAAIGLAADAVHAGLVPRLRGVLTELVARRRRAAGFAPALEGAP